MSEPFNLEELVLLWQQQFGTLKSSKKFATAYYLIPFKERFELLKILVWKIKELGKPKEFFTNETKKRIVNSCIPHEKSVDAKTYKGFVQGTTMHVNMAITFVYNPDNADYFAVDFEKEEVEISKKPHEWKKFDSRNSSAEVADEMIDEEFAKLFESNKK